MNVLAVAKRSLIELSSQSRTRQVLNISRRSKYLKKFFKFDLQHQEQSWPAILEQQNLPATLADPGLYVCRIPTNSASEPAL